MGDTMKKAISLIGLLMALAIPSGLLAQQAGYSQTNLVSNTAGVANTTDPQLLNPWGISILPGQDFWIANNNSGTSTLLSLIHISLPHTKEGSRGRSPRPRIEVVAMAAISPLSRLATATSALTNRLTRTSPLLCRRQSTRSTRCLRNRISSFTPVI